LFEKREIISAAQRLVHIEREGGMTVEGHGGAQETSVIAQKALAAA
jgi:hypothetical protein